MDNTYAIVEDIDTYLKETKAKRFYFRLMSPEGDMVWTTGGWANCQASKLDWEPDAEVFYRSNLKDRYNEISRDHTRGYPTFAAATEMKIVEAKEDAE